MRRPSPRTGASDADVEDLEVDRAGRNLHIHAIALLVAEQRLGDRRADGELALAQVGLVFGDDRIDHLFVVVVVEQGHLAQDLHLALVDLRLVDHPGIGDRILELGDAHLKQALGLPGGVVLRILRQVALVARLGNGCRDRRALDGTHVVELLLELLVPFRRQINSLFCHNSSYIKIRILAGEGQNPVALLGQR